MDHLTFIVLGLYPNLMVSVNGGLFVDFRELWAMPLVSKTVLHLADESRENLLMDSGGSARLEKLRELYLAWRRDTFGGDPTAPLQYLWEKHQEDGARLFTDMHEA